MERVFDQLLTEPFSSVLKPTDDLIEFEQEFTPPCDVIEEDTHFLLTFDLPGVKKEDVKIELRDQQLLVSGERKREIKEEVKGRLTQERFYGSFLRSFVLPTHVDIEKVEANFDNGVLQISLPKTELSHAKQIPIKEGKLLTHKKDIKTEKAA
jgi:HSP20 family protein